MKKMLMGSFTCWWEGASAVKVIRADTALAAASEFASPEEQYLPGLDRVVFAHNNATGKTHRITIFDAFLESRK